MMKFWQFLVSNVIRSRLAWRGWAPRGLPAILLVAFLVSSGGVLAKAQEAKQPAMPAPGNYCTSCHLAGDPRLAGVTEWQGGIAHTEISDCPAAVRVAEELYYTERLMLLIDRAAAHLPAATFASTTLPRRIESASQVYYRLLDAPVTSLDAFVSEAQVGRYRLGKLNNEVSQLLQEQKIQRILIVAGLVTVFVLISLAWGLRHTGWAWSFGRRPTTGAGKGQAPGGLLVALAVPVLVFALFSLPLFRVLPAEVAAASEYELEQQAALDNAQRTVTAADRLQGRAVILAQLGAAWQPLDPEQARAAFQAAKETLEEGRRLSQAYWGAAQAAQELAAGDAIVHEKASLAAASLQATRDWEWAAPAVAAALAEVDPEQAKVLLRASEAALQSQAGIYADLQRRMLALAWQPLDDVQSGRLAASIADPAVRAWTWRELAQQARNPAAFITARQATLAISDPLRRARSLTELARLSGESTLFDQAQQSLVGAEGYASPASLAFAWADLAAASGRAELVERIDPVYPAALALAWLKLGQYEPAWQAAGAISDPYERGRAQAAIASAWQNSQAATEISVPLYRDLAYRNLVRQQAVSAELLDRFSLVYPRLQALTALSRFEAAWQLAQDPSTPLSETYPLVELAAAWARTDPQAAMQVVERISREFDRTQVFLGLVGDLQPGQAGEPAGFDQAQFERILELALAARLRGDAQAPARLSALIAERLLASPWCQAASSETCLEWARLAMDQALSAALRIPLK